MAVKDFRSSINLAEKDVTVITPQRKWLDLNLKAIWKSRQLIWLIFKRDFIAANKQSVLGPFWYIIPPIFGAFTSNFIFGTIAKLPTDGIPSFIFYMSGAWIWGYFSGNVMNESNILSSNAGIFGKVYFPRLVMPIADLLLNGVSHLISLGVLAFFWAYFYFRGSNISLNINLLFLPLLILIVNASSLGIGLILSSIGYRYHDVPKLFSPLLLIARYLSPVVYPLSTLEKGSTLYWVAMANPMTHIIELFRYSIFGVGSPNYWGLLYMGLFTIVVLFLGLIIFNIAEQNFMDSV